MNMTFDSNRFNIVKFFSYPCVVINRTAEYEGPAFNGTRGDESVKEFFDAVLAEAQKITGRHLKDNKIAFEIIDNETGSLFYVGYKDNIWCFGDHLHPEVNSSYTLDLINYVKE